MKEMNASAALSDDAAQHEIRGGPGRRLRQAREAVGLSTDYVAAELHLTPSTIDALEREAYESLPAPVFVSGYLRNYARLLRLDPDPLVKAYLAEARADQYTPARPPPGTDGARPGGRLLALASLAVVVVLAGLVALWWQNEPDPLALLRPTDAPESSLSGAGDAPEDAGRQVASPAAPAAPVAETRAPSPEPIGTPPPEPQRSGEPTTPEAQAPTAPQPATDAAEPTPELADEPEPAQAGSEEATAEPDKPPQVVLTFDGPCWVDIRDATREFKLFGEMGEGDRRVLAGSPPYSVIIGNAAATTIRIDGQEFDLSRHARGNVARFTLDPATAPAHSSEQSEPNEQ